MEKMEIENAVEESALKAGEPETGAKGTKWIRNDTEGTKMCDACGAVMRGWAFREPFQFCPKCGAMAEKAM